MTGGETSAVEWKHGDRFVVGGKWVKPRSQPTVRSSYSCANWAVSRRRSSSGTPSAGLIACTMPALLAGYTLVIKPSPQASHAQ